MVHISWTAPMTAVDGNAYTAADFNREIRDNLNCTAPALAGVVGSYFICESTNTLIERQFASDVVETSQTTTSTTYADLSTVGPTVTVDTLDSAVVWFACAISNSTVDIQTTASVEVSGASSVTPLATWALYGDGKRAASPERSFSAYKFNGLNPGSNTFTMKYRVGTGGTTGTFSNRRLVVMPL